MRKRVIVVSALLLCTLLLIMASFAQAACSCSGPSQPDPATEIGAKAAVVGGIIALAGYHYFKHRNPKS